MGSLLKNIMVIGGLLLIAAAGYYLLVVNGSSTIGGNNALVAGQAEQETQEFLRRLNEIESIKLSPQIFNDPRFDSFVDFTEPVEPQSFGRDNPFEAQ